MNLFDPVLNGMARSEFYRALHVPELFPEEKPMLLHNWSQQDLEMYVGGEYCQPPQNL